MKKLVTIFFLFFSTSLLAQQFNNEWIDYNKTYYKFKVGVSGLYRIPQAALAAANLAGTDVNQFQLWRNGVEVPIFTSGQSGALPTDGYIEFWGEANDGTADLPLYRSADYQINNNKSLFTDSASYFLTVNTTGANKRMAPVANTIPTGVGPEPYFIYTAGMYPNESIHLGPYGGEISAPAMSASYEQGEGWTSNEINEITRTRNFSLSNLFPYTGSGAPQVQVRFNVVGNSPNNRNVLMSLNGSQVFGTALNFFNYAKLVGTVPVSQLSAGAGAQTFTVTNEATNANNRIKVGFFELTYPRMFNFGGASNFRFTIGASNTGKYLEISGFNYSGVPVLYDLTNGRRYVADVSNPLVVKIYLQPSSVAADLVLVSQAANNVKPIANITTRNFVNYRLAANQGDYLMITHNAILNASDGSNPVEDYRVYRSSAAGGGYVAKTYMIDQLNDQFAFGIKNSPLSIRNFLRFARSNFSSPLKSVFLIGRGVKAIAARSNESSTVTDRLNLIPSFGEPSSDVLLSAEGSSSVPLTPIGRLSVVNGNEFVIYLQKIKQYEQHHTPVADVNGSLWKKNIMHIIGADDLPTITALQSALNRDKLVVSDTLFGANVSDFAKGGSAGAEQTATDRLRGLMNEGVNMLTYFGHSGTSTLMFNIDEPANYSNAGKYPLFHMMGCNVGDIFVLDESRLSAISTISEKYLFAKERGSIGMMAGTSIGFIGNLSLYNQQLYQLIAREGYAKPIGDLMKLAIENLFKYVGGENDTYSRSQAEEFVINGDPAIRLYQQPKPDYAIEDAMITVNPSIISVADNSFTINASIANLGRATKRPVIVELKRTFPDLSVRVIRRDTIPGVRYLDSLSYTIPVDPTVDKGANKFTISIDPENLIDELFESNNMLVKDVFIYEDDIKPVFPYNYAIVNTQNIVFAASTGNPLASSKSYVIEVDTTKQFNSGFKKTQTKVSTGGVVEFSPGVTFRDSTVYYWRVSAVPSQPTDQPVWNGASFTYIPGNQTGFSQSDPEQFNETIHDKITISPTTGQFLYDSLVSEIIVTNSLTSTIPQDYALQIDGNYVQQSFLSPFSVQENSLRFYVIDNRNLQPLVNRDLGTSGLYGSYRPLIFNTTTIPGFFQFDVSTVDARRKVMSFLDSIPTGFYIALTSNQRGQITLPSVWQSDTAVLGKNISLYHKFKTAGLSDIDLIKSIVPYVFIYQKGIPQPLVQMVGADRSAQIKAMVNVRVSGTTGNIISPVFTKAATWSNLVWDGSSLENPNTDNATITISGVDRNGRETQLISGVPISQRNVDLSSISAATYPGLKLTIQATDGTNRTPYQLKNWRIYGTPVPEGAIAPNIYYSTKDTVAVGEILNLGVAFKNISNYKFDSLAVKLSVRDRNNVERNIPLSKVKPLVQGDTVRVDIPIETKSLTGTNLAFLEFNPEGSGYQPEQYQFNNFISKNFYVVGDSLNPFMDVTFDGMRILNRDIVSSKPNISIKLTDDAKYLLLNTTDLVKVQLRYPDGVLRDFAFDSDTLTLTPPGEGTNDANTALVSFKPNLLQDGEYELVVSGKDQTGNKSGNIDYRVTFQVINKPMISNLLNYPNPFTTSTAFVFTLTGSEIPQNLRIQILTVTGKIVREITKAELGPLRIGRNITEFKWDGTDQYGQKLGNGVYLYRVLTNLNGKQLDKYKSSDDNTDRYFNKGYGKMVLIR